MMKREYLLNLYGMEGRRCPEVNSISINFFYFGKKERGPKIFKEQEPKTFEE